MSVTKEETEEEEEKEPPARVCYSSSSSDTEVNEDIADFGSLVIEEAGSGSENSASEAGEEEAIMTAGRHRKKSRGKSTKEDSGGEERHQLTRPGSNYSQRSVSYFVDLGMEKLQSFNSIFDVYKYTTIYKCGYFR